jgi:predicted RNA-binding protein
MCEANAYWVKEGKEELILESVDILEPMDDGKWKLVGIFGEQMIVEGRIRGMKLVEHKIFFER